VLVGGQVGVVGDGGLEPGGGGQGGRLGRRGGLCRSQRRD